MNHPRRAFSLLEVVLALAILTITLAVALTLLDMGVRSAREARDQSRAQELAENIMGLLTSRVLDVYDVEGDQNVADVLASAGMNTGVGDVDLQSEEDYWNCSIASEDAGFDGLLKVTVRVSDGSSSRPVEFTLARWLMDPAYLQTLTDANSAASTSGAAPSSSTSASSSTGSP